MVPTYCEVIKFVNQELGFKNLMKKQLRIKLKKKAICLIVFQSNQWMYYAMIGPMVAELSKGILTICVTLAG